MQNHCNITIVDISADTVSKDSRKIESFPRKRRIESAIHLRKRRFVNIIIVSRTIIICCDTFSGRILICIHLILIPQRISIFRIYSCPLYHIEIIHRTTYLQLVHTTSRHIFQWEVCHLILIMRQVHTQFPYPTILIDNRSVKHHFYTCILQGSYIFVNRTISQGRSYRT